MLIDSDVRFQLTTWPLSHPGVLPWEENGTSIVAGPGEISNAGGIVAWCVAGRMGCISVVA